MQARANSEQRQELVGRYVLAAVAQTVSHRVECLARVAHVQCMIVGRHWGIGRARIQTGRDNPR